MTARTEESGFDDVRPVRGNLWLGGGPISQTQLDSLLVWISAPSSSVRAVHLNQVIDQLVQLREPHLSYTGQRQPELRGARK